MAVISVAEPEPVRYFLVGAGTGAGVKGPAPARAPP